MTVLPADISLRYNKKILVRKLVKLPKTSEEYLGWNPKDGYKYEWINGKLLKTNTMIQPEQQFIADNLLDIFNKTTAFAEGGRLSVEVKSKTLEDHYRVPDLAYFTLSQRKIMIEGQAVVPQLAIEILSKTDNIYDTIDKTKEYFYAGVQLVWWIIPPVESIYCFTGLSKMTICNENIICDATSIVKGFSFKSKDIFKKLK